VPCARVPPVLADAKTLLVVESRRQGRSETDKEDCAWPNIPRQGARRFQEILIAGREVCPTAGEFDSTPPARALGLPVMPTNHHFCVAHPSEAGRLHAEVVRCRFAGGLEIKLEIPRRSRHSQCVTLAALIPLLGKGKSWRNWLG
jgi:hypothetical protein